jgi:hypothetical protein
LASYESDPGRQWEPPFGGQAFTDFVWQVGEGEVPLSTEPITDFSWQASKVRLSLDGDGPEVLLSFRSGPVPGEEPIILTFGFSGDAALEAAKLVEQEARPKAPVPFTIRTVGAPVLTFLLAHDSALALATKLREAAGGWAP